MEIVYRDDVKAVIDEMIERLPGAKSGKAFGFPAYKANGKVFCFVGGKGIGLKLSPERVKEVMATYDETRPFEPVSGTVWKAWVTVEREQAGDFHRDFDLLAEAMQTVLG